MFKNISNCYTEQKTIANAKSVMYGTELLLASLCYKNVQSTFSFLCSLKNYIWFHINSKFLLTKLENFILLNYHLLTVFISSFFVYCIQKIFSIFSYMQ